MYSEILVAGCDTQFDDETQSDVMYLLSISWPGWIHRGRNMGHIQQLGVY